MTALFFKLTLTLFMLGAPVEPSDGVPVFDPCSAPEMCDLGPTGWHQFYDGGGPYSCEWEGCHEDDYVGHCGDKHWPCAFDEEEFAYLQPIVDAVELGDVDAALTAFAGAAVEGSDRVLYNAQREAWQLLSCDLKTVVAHVPSSLSSETIEAR
jgi:hypothetical protein